MSQRNIIFTIDEHGMNVRVLTMVKLNTGQRPAQWLRVGDHFAHSCLIWNVKQLDASPIWHTPRRLLISVIFILSEWSISFWRSTIRTGDNDANGSMHLTGIMVRIYLYNKKEWLYCVTTTKKQSFTPQIMERSQSRLMMVERAT